MPQKNEIYIVAAATTGDLAPLFDVNSDLLRFKYTSIGSQLYIDGIIMSLDLEILFKDLADPVKNGIYSVTNIVQIGADYTYTFTRTYQSLLTLRRSAMIFVSSGTVNAQSFFVMNVGDDYTMEVDASFFSNVVTPPANPPTALYVDNINGDDGNNGLTPATALKTFDTAFIRQQNVPNSELILIASPTNYVMTSAVMVNGNTIAFDDRMLVRGDSFTEIQSNTTTGSIVTSAVVDVFASTTLVTLDAAVLVAGAHVGQLYRDAAGAYWSIIANTTTTITIAGDDNGVIGVWAIVIPAATLEFDIGVPDIYLTNVLALNQLNVVANIFHVPNNGVIQTNTSIFNADLVVNETGVTNFVRTVINSSSFLIDDKADINCFDSFIAIGLVVTGVTRIVMHGSYILGNIIGSGANIELATATVEGYVQIVNCLLTTNPVHINNPSNSSLSCESCQVYISDVTLLDPSVAIPAPIALFDNSQVFINSSLELLGNKTVGMLGSFVARGGSQISIGSTGNLIMNDGNYEYGLDINNNSTLTNNGTITFNLNHIVSPFHIAVDSEYSNNGTVTIALASPYSIYLNDNSTVQLNSPLVAPADTTAFAGLFYGCDLVVNDALTLAGGSVNSFVLDTNCSVLINNAVNVLATNISSFVYLTADSKLAINGASAVVSYVGGSLYDFVAETSSILISKGSTFNSTGLGATLSSMLLNNSSMLNIPDTSTYQMVGGTPIAFDISNNSSIVFGPSATITSGAAFGLTGIRLNGICRLVIGSAASLTNIFGPGGAGVDDISVWSTGVMGLPAAGTSYFDAAPAGDLSSIFVRT